MELQNVFEEVAQVFSDHQQYCQKSVVIIFCQKKEKMKKKNAKTTTRVCANFFFH